MPGALTAATLVVGASLGVSLIWGNSLAAFTSSAQNSGNSFALGSVTLADNDQGSVFFADTNIKPGATDTSCVKVTYSGTLNSSGVKLYASSLTGTGLGSYVTFTIEEGTATAATGGAALDCTGFSATSTLYSGTLAGFAAANTGFASGLSSWTPTSAGGSRAYRVTYTLQNNTSAQGLTCGVTLTWQARG